MMRSLKLMQFNLENFFIYLDGATKKPYSELNETEWQQLTQSTEKLKPIRKVRQIAQLILQEAPDILIVNEMGGPESAENFCRLFLDNEYTPKVKEGNSNRGIDVGYLVRADLPFECLLISHKNRPIHFLYQHEVGGNLSSHYFSRDVAELRLFSQKSPHSPFLILLAAHLKSKLDPDGVDPKGRSRRAAEVKTLVEIYNEVQKETDGKIPIVVGGDFNGIASPLNTELEFLQIYEQTDLNDVFHLMEVPQDMRTTQVNFDPAKGMRPVQIDYFFIAEKFSEKIVKEKTKVIRFNSHLGLPAQLPQSMDERSELPSDHFPISFEILLFDNI